MADRQNNNAKKPSDGARAAAIVFGGIFIVIALLYILKATGDRKSVV